MSKLDELMALARECGNIERRHCIGKAQGFDVRDAYAALEDALKAVVEDAERYRWMRNFGREEDWQQWWELDPQEKLDAAIDAARKPS